MRCLQAVKLITGNDRMVVPFFYPWFGSSLSYRGFFCFYSDPNIYSK